MANETQIEVRPSSGSGRQVADRQPINASLASRSQDIEAAIRQAISIASQACEAPSSQSWGVKNVEMSFGIKLTAESSVIVTKASVEAALEVTVTIERS